jgi:hypothetical protein
LCRAAQPALVVIANEAKAVQAVKDVSPGTFVLYRCTGADRPTPEQLSYLGGLAYGRLMLPGLKAEAPQADAYQVFNEAESNDDPWQLLALSESYRGLMSAASEIASSSGK